MTKIIIKTNLKLLPDQKTVYNAPERLIVVPSTRRSGKSTYIERIGAIKALEGKQVAILEREYTEAKKVYKS